MKNAFIEQIFVAGEKKLVKIIDFPDFCLINNNLKVKDFSSGYDQNGIGYEYDLVECFKDGFLVAKYKLGEEDSLEAYNYNFDMLARANFNRMANSINSNKYFLKFARDFSVEDENCK